ncbi:MAG: lipoate protein ligase C-terminal domain-containing protein, partial [Candidatus Bathyarchaeia archaeon]
FRDKLYASLRERMTTIKRETKSLPDEDHVRGLLKKHYEESLKIRLMPGELSEAEIELIEKVEDTYKRPEWLNMVRERHKDLIQKRSVKVSGRSRIGEAAFKARGGLIRVLLEILDSKIRDDMITGDFSFIPASYLQKLEKMLIGSRLIPSAITDRIHSFYMRHGIQSPQVAPEDFTDAIMQAVR